jgi:hypothetical protein
MMQAIRKARSVSHESIEMMYERVTSDKLDEDPKPHPSGVQIGHFVCVELPVSASKDTATHDCNGDSQGD